MKIALCLLVCALLAGPAAAASVTTEESGEISFVADARTFTSVICGTFGPDWQWAGQGDAADVADVTRSPEERELTGTLPVAGTEATVGFTQRVSRQSEDALRAEYSFTVNEMVQFNSLFVSVRLRVEEYAGKEIAFRDAGGRARETLSLPETLSAAQLYRHDGIREIQVAEGTPLGYTLICPGGARVLLQDNREWGELEFELRFDLLAADPGAPTPGGTRFERVLVFTFPEAVDFQLDPDTAVSRTDTTGWVPYTMPWDGAPLDLSWLNEAPAGEHGFVEVRDGKFAFEDRTPARFWGVCMSAAGNFPTHEQSEKIAARMAKFGLNMVRTHHADAGWSDPNLFDESQGDTRHFDVDALDRFDYFLYCLKKHGIYVYLDQLVHRRFTEGDGVANASELDFAAKPYTIFDPRLIRLQKEFSANLWTHVNPYTGLAYKDDPGIALMEFTNENDLMAFEVSVEPYASALEARWDAWAAANGVDPDQPIRQVAARSADVLRFLDEVQREYYADMHAYLRSLGVRVPIAGNTWLVYPANLPSQVTMDFMDSHSYWDHPYDDYRRFHNRPQVKADPGHEGTNPSVLAPSRVEGKPYVCSEWGHPWPNEWRAEGALPLAAIGSFQGWDGVLAYTYRHSTETPVEKLEGYFDTFNDPCVFGLLPAAALIFRRGDVSAAQALTAVLWEGDDVFSTKMAWTPAPAYRALVEQTGLVTSLGGPTEAGTVVAPEEALLSPGQTAVESDTGELRRDWQTGVATIDTARTQAAYGFLGETGEIALSDVTLTIETPFATVAASSLDGAPLRTSGHVLITAVGRAENTGMEYNLTRTRLRSWGSAPILIEPVVGRLVMQTEMEHCSVYAVGPEGGRSLLGTVAAEGGTVTIDLSAKAGTIYYEVRAPTTVSEAPAAH